MNWLKATWAAVGTAFLAALAIFAAMSAQGHKRSARKWQEKATDAEEQDIANQAEVAKAANEKAAQHHLRADERRAKAEERINSIGAKNEEIADILDRWRSS